MTLLYLMSWFSLPSVSDTYTSPGVGTTSGILSLATDYSAPFFANSVFILGIAVGIPISVVALKWLISLLKTNIKKPIYLPLVYNPKFKYKNTIQYARIYGHDPGGKKFKAWQKRTPRMWYYG